MSTSLARKIRRIGLERVANTSVVTLTDEQGNATEATDTTYQTRRRYMSEDELSMLTNEMIETWRERRKKNR